METSSFSDQLRLADKYFLAQLLLCFREPTSSGLVIIQNMYFPEVGVASKQPLFQKNNFFRSRYLLRAVTFSEMLVLRNQVCCIYTWIDFPLTISIPLSILRVGLTLSILRVGLKLLNSLSLKKMYEFQYWMCYKCDFLWSW